jgi:hypothetical protein
MRTADLMAVRHEEMSDGKMSDNSVGDSSVGGSSVLDTSVFDSGVIDTDQTPLALGISHTGTDSYTDTATAAVSEDAVVLTLNDLLPDHHGDIVLLNQAGTLEMAVVTDKRVVDTGVAEHHTTADGTDVAGMTYYSFEAGPTLYVPADMSLSVIAGPIG